MLYHYTNIETLVGILSKYKDNKATNKWTVKEGDLTFWASNLYSMNDPQEMHHGIKFLQKVIPAIENLFKDRPSDVPGIIDEMNDFMGAGDEKELMQKLDDYLLKVGLSPFSLSFSKAEDKLPMWKMYGDNGNGVALLFDDDLLKNEFENLIFADAVNYGFNVKNPNVIGTIISSINKRFNKTKQEFIKDNVLTSAGMFAFVCPFLKDESYEYEKEYRVAFVAKEHSDTKFRVRGNRIIPYVEVSIPIKYLKGVVIGPCLLESETKRALHHLFLGCGIDSKNMIIKQSDIHYRE